MAVKRTQQSEVIVVSGLPRSGTSMMMKMLEGGGLPVMTDHQRTADADNPKGYYEFERVKQLPKGDKAWVADASGKVVKVISALLQHLPPEQSYRVLFMRRSLPEVLDSQRKMLQRRGETSQADDAQMQMLFTKHLEKIEAWLNSQPNMSVLYVNYNQLLAEPAAQLQRINDFFDGALDSTAMSRVVDPALYRNRQ